jgi:putative ABC transport system substrate-binding protein
MLNIFRIWFGSSRCGNLKSKIEDLKWLGLSVFAFVLVMAGAVAEAQQPKKVPLLGYLLTGSAASVSASSEGIRLALHGRGYIEGQTIASEYRYAQRNLDRLPELAVELAHLKVDIIVVTGGDPDIRAAKNATKTIPIVMVGSGSDPVKAGFI